MDASSITNFMTMAKTALSEGSCPVRIVSFTYASENGLTREIMALDEKLGGIDKSIEQWSGQVERLNVTIGNLKKGLARVQAERIDLERKTEDSNATSLKSCVDEIHGNIDRLLARAEAVVEAPKDDSVNIPTAPEESVEDIFHWRGIQ